MVLCVGPSSATFVFGSAMSQDPLPACTSRTLCNGEVCGDVCEDGSVEVSPWLSFALDFQRNLTRSRSFAFGPHLGTHNALISRANGFGLEEDFFAMLFSMTGNVSSAHVRVPNQRYGLLDLLNLGVRHVEYDIWDVPSPNGGPNASFEVRICHSPVPDPLGSLAAEEALQRLGMKGLDWDPLLSLCSTITLESAMLKTKAWLDAHPSEVIGCYLLSSPLPTTLPPATNTRALLTMKKVYTPTSHHSTCPEITASPPGMRTSSPRPSLVCGESPS